MNTADNQTLEQEADVDFDEEYEGEDYELETSEAIAELKDELSVQSELLEQLVATLQEKMEQEKLFQDKLIETLEKIANK